MKVASFSVATNRVWKENDGSKKEQTDYHNIVVFGSQAETSAQYLKKGSSVLVEGRIQTRNWENKEGQKMYRTEIIAERVQFGPRPKIEEGEATEEEIKKMDNTTSPGVDGEVINVDDIPF